MWGTPKLQRASLFRRVAGGSGGTDETGTSKDAHQLTVKQRGTLRCVPAICDILYSASCALLPYWHRRCTLIPSAGPSASKGIRFKVLLGFFPIKLQQGNPSLLRDLPQCFLVDVSAES